MYPDTRMDAKRNPSFRQGLASASHRWQSAAVNARQVIVVALLPLAVLVGAESARADDATPGDPKRVALVLARVLAYDRNLTARAGTDVSVMVLHTADEGAAACGATMTTAFRDLGTARIQGLPILVSDHLFVDNADLERAVESGADAVFVCDGIDIAAIGPILKANQVLGLGPSRRAVADGLAVGVAIDAGGTARISVNLGVSKGSGADLSSDLLAISEVIR
jgi:hypothetical protein